MCPPVLRGGYDRSFLRQLCEVYICKCFWYVTSVHYLSVCTFQSHSNRWWSLVQRRREPGESALCRRQYSSKCSRCRYFFEGRLLCVRYSQVPVDVSESVDSIYSPGWFHGRRQVSTTLVAGRRLVTQQTLQDVALQYFGVDGCQRYLPIWRYQSTWRWNQASGWWLLPLCTGLY